MAIGVIIAKEISSVFDPGDHWSTYGGNPLACAAGYAVTRYIIEKDIPGNAAKMGKYLLTRLEELKQKHSVIADVRGIGLLIAVEFKEEIAGAVMKACLEKGFMINLLKPNLLRVIPPLIITRAEVDEGLGILDEVLEGMGK
jgi:acetylornithine/succinyldiaminopimelate/putrescine aminotransferase